MEVQIVVNQYQGDYVVIKQMVEQKMKNEIKRKGGESSMFIQDFSYLLTVIGYVRIGKTETVQIIVCDANDQYIFDLRIFKEQLTLTELLNVIKQAVWQQKDAYINHMEWLFEDIMILIAKSYEELGTHFVLPDVEASLHRIDYGEILIDEYGYTPPLDESITTKYVTITTLQPARDFPSLRKFWLTEESFLQVERRRTSEIFYKYQKWVNDELVEATEKESYDCHHQKDYTNYVHY